MLLPFFTYGVLWGHNNIGSPQLSEKDIDHSYKRATHWLVTNSDEIIKDGNPYLWWMLNESLVYKDNFAVRGMIDRFRKITNRSYLNSPWAYLVYGTNGNVNADQVVHLRVPDYVKYFIYGYSCNKALGERTIIQKQNDTSFCLKEQPLSPACVTHQVMGFRFLQRVGCNEVPEVEEKIHRLSETIEYQLIFDPRMVDVYIQRVLMLVDSNNPQKINPLWLKRVLDGQLKNGGWGDFQPLIAIGNRALGFTKRGVAIRSEKATFHATAQGLLLMAMLQANDHEAFNLMGNDNL